MAHLTQICPCQLWYISQLFFYVLCMYSMEQRIPTQKALMSGIEHFLESDLRRRSQTSCALPRPLGDQQTDLTHNPPLSGKTSPIGAKQPTLSAQTSPLLCTINPLSANSTLSLSLYYHPSFLDGYAYSLHYYLCQDAITSYPQFTNIPSLPWVSTCIWGL